MSDDVTPRRGNSAMPSEEPDDHGCTPSTDEMGGDAESLLARCNRMVDDWIERNPLWRALHRPAQDDVPPEQKGEQDG